MKNMKIIKIIKYKKIINYRRLLMVYKTKLYNITAAIHITA
jgi:hypothetical protein